MGKGRLTHPRQSLFQAAQRGPLLSFALFAPGASKLEGFLGRRPGGGLVLAGRGRAGLGRGQWLLTERQ